MISTMNQNQTDLTDDSFTFLENWQKWMFTFSSTICAVITVVGQGMIIHYIIKYASKERPINKLVLIDQVGNIKKLKRCLITQKCIFSG